MTNSEIAKFFYESIKDLNDDDFYEVFDELAKLYSDESDTHDIYSFMYWLVKVINEIEREKQPDAGTIILTMQKPQFIYEGENKND